LTELKGTPDLDEWWDMINAWKKECPLEFEREDGKLRTEYVIEKISQKTEGNAVIVSDVGQHQMWTAQHYQYNHPRCNLTSGGLGTMGFSLPAAMGAHYGVKDRTVFSISGDGGFQMNLQELITISHYKMPLKIVIINNSFLGMVRQWQELFHAEKFSFTDLGASNPDFVKVGEAFGIPSYSTSDPNEVDALLDKAMEIKDGPVLIEFKVVKEDMVFPMVPSGASISDMIVKRLNPKRMV